MDGAKDTSQLERERGSKPGIERATKEALSDYSLIDEDLSLAEGLRTLCR
jgi:hypothetical protein